MDREKVIKGLECCLDYNEPICDKCPYRATEEDRQHVDWDCHKDEFQHDALELLKEQEAKQTPKDIKSYYGLAGGPHGACPSCCTTIPRIIGQETRFCPFCGQAVKWDG